VAVLALHTAVSRRTAPPAITTTWVAVSVANPSRHHDGTLIDILAIPVIGIGGIHTSGTRLLAEITILIPLIIKSLASIAIILRNPVTSETVGIAQVAHSIFVEPTVIHSGVVVSVGLAGLIAPSVVGLSGVDEGLTDVEVERRAAVGHRVALGCVAG